jgi:hypothetical protein
MNARRFRLFADHNQFYLYDSRHPGAMDPGGWPTDLMETRVVSERGFLGVFTDREFRVPISVQVLTDEPREALSDASLVVDASLDCPSGVVLLRGCTETDDQAQTIPIEPGSYRARIIFRRLGSSFLGFIGFDSYQILLWPGEPLAPRRVSAQLARVEA